MKQSEKNLILLENFLLFATHSCRVDDNESEVYTSKDLYEAATNYIEEDHVDGKPADKPERIIVELI